MPTVLLPSKFLYLATPKTASTSTGHELRNTFGARMYRKHASIREVPEYDGELAFTTVRNPYDLIVSWFTGVKIPMTLADFVRRHTGKHFVRHDKLFWHVVDGVETIRYEHLENDLAAMLDRVGLPPVALPVPPTKRTVPWESFYDAEALAAVNARFGEEIERFGYEQIS